MSRTARSRFPRPFRLYACGQLAVPHFGEERGHGDISYQAMTVAAETLRANGVPNRMDRDRDHDGGSPRQDSPVSAAPVAG